MTIQITITDAGRAEIINAQNTGTAPLTITQVGFGTGQYSPTHTQTALQAEVKRLSTIAGEVVADDTIHVTVKDEGNSAYNVGEFGLYTASGTLFAVYSQTGAYIMQKLANSSLLLSVDVVLATLNATSLTFGDVSFTNPPATETVMGVVELATAAETETGTDNTRAVHPAGLKPLLDAKAPLASPALTGNPTAPTPAHFDNDTSLATTAFVQRALGNYRTYAGISGNNTLSASEAGGLFEITSGSTGTTTLPAATSKAGLCFTFNNTSAYPQTIASQGGNFYGSGVSGSGTFSIPAGVQCQFISDGGNWKVVSHVGIFSLGGSGYQKLPSGMIIQWGVASSTNVTFPISFPNNCAIVVATLKGSFSDYSFSVTGTTNSGYTASRAATVSWFSIGY